MAGTKPNIYSLIICDNRKSIGKAHKRKYYNKLRDTEPKILELLEKGVCESKIAIETRTTLDFIRRVKYIHDCEKRGETFEANVYELSRHKEYQKEDGKCKPIGLSITALVNALKGHSGTVIKVRRAIRHMDLEQLIENQVTDGMTDIVFDENYYNIKNCEIDYKKLADTVDTWPCIIRRIANELNIPSYLKFAFEKSNKYCLLPQQIGQLLIYSDIDMFKDKYCGYNYVGLAKKTNLQLDKVVGILKQKNNI